MPETGHGAEAAAVGDAAVERAGAEVPLVERPSGPAGWAGLAGRAVVRSVAYATPGAERRRAERFVATGVPLPRLTPATALHAALDELVLGGFQALRGSFATEELGRVEHEAIRAVRLFEEQGWLADPRRYHAEPPPPDEVSLGRRRVGRTVFETLRFDSGWAPHPDEPGAARWRAYPENGRVRVLMLRHGDGRRPWVVCVHGAEMGGRPIIDSQILRTEHLHRELGFNVVMPVLPRHGPRRAGTSGSGVDSFPGIDMLDNVHGLAQAAWDVRRLLRWIERREPEGLALTGFSLGGYVSALVAGLEGPLDAVVAGCPAVDLPGLFRRHSPRSVREHPRVQALFHEAELLHRVVSPLSFVPATPPERLFVYGGLADRLAHPAEQAGRLSRHWGEPGVLWSNRGHVTNLIGGSTGAFVDDSLRSSVPGCRPPR